MEAIEYLKMKSKFCKKWCESCPMNRNSKGLPCEELEKKYPEEAAKLFEDYANLKNWSDENA